VTQPPSPAGWAHSLTQFLTVEAAGGIVLLASASVALAVANSPFAGGYEAFWKTPVGISAGALVMEHSLRHWINDGLMAVFFLVVGLEVKRELVIGELRERRAAMLPLAAAAGGMLVPAAAYLALQWGREGAAGWGIPMATDIAFVVGCLAVLGPRVPHGLRIFVLSLAIIDDIGAILVIAIGYSAGLNWVALALGATGVAVSALLIRYGVVTVMPLAVAAVLTWLAFHESGVHATIAGVLLGLLAPARPAIPARQMTSALDRLRRRIGYLQANDAAPKAVATSLASAADALQSPLERLEHALHPFVSFVVMPVFALANAGVTLNVAAVASPVAVAVAAGLVVGKPLGIVAFAWLAVNRGWTSLPAGVSWPLVLGAGCLAGVGFTMALFIASLALDGPRLEHAKAGVLAGSLVAGMLGLWLIARAIAAPPHEDA